jgi:nitroimidazol reductase NimA-like FMN-containing flavoprotein (pyridoxamine 5'-phosphate oxidase superfamily)
MSDAVRPMRRKDREITDRAEIDAILDEAETLVLSLWDGAEPYAVPVNFVRVGGDLFFHCARQGRKLDIIAERPRVGFAAVAEARVETGAEPCDCTTYYRSAIGWGTAAVLEDPAEKAAALAALNRKHGAPDGPFPPQMLAATAVVRIAVDRVTGKAKRPAA